MGLPCYLQAFSSCPGGRGVISRYGGQPLIARASLAVGHRLESSDSVEVVRKLSSLEACGIFLDQGLSPRPLHSRWILLYH